VPHAIPSSIPYKVTATGNNLDIALTPERNKTKLLRTPCAEFALSDSYYRQKQQTKTVRCWSSYPGSNPQLPQLSLLVRRTRLGTVTLAVLCTGSRIASGGDAGTNAGNSGAATDIPFNG